MKFLLNVFYFYLDSLFLFFFKFSKKLNFNTKISLSFNYLNLITDLNYIRKFNKYKTSYIYTNNKFNWIINSNYYILNNIWLYNFFKKLLLEVKNIFINTFSFSYIYLKGFILILIMDACITDDEPLWEPLEWSLVQTWILFIFSFAWIGENLILSRYGGYTGKDKRVWMSWYKTFWLIEGFYMINYGLVSLFIIVPFYYEVNYKLSLIYSWWHWYSRLFFFKFISMFSIIMILAILLQISLRWNNWKKSFFIVLLINIFFGYLLYTNFITLFFGYFTDPTWFQKTRPIDYIQLSHEPGKWGWGMAKRDHFTYHPVRTNFWFKNDSPFAASFIQFHFFFFISLFLTFIYWISLLRRILSTKEIPMTFTIYCISSLRQFLYFFLFIYCFIFLSFISNYWRFPVEQFYFIDNNGWLLNFYYILMDYVDFIINIF